MMKELDTDEVYLYDGGEGDAEIFRIKEGTPFGPFVFLETTSAAGESGYVEIHSPDTAARLALALLARAVTEEDGEGEPKLKKIMAMLEGIIRRSEAERDFKIGELVQVYDASYGDLDWLNATVLEYTRHGGYLVRGYWDKLELYSPANIRKVKRND